MFMLLHAPNQLSGTDSEALPKHTIFKKWFKMYVLYTLMLHALLACQIVKNDCNDTYLDLQPIYLN